MDLTSSLETSRQDSSLVTEDNLLQSAKKDQEVTSLSVITSEDVENNKVVAKELAVIASVETMIRSKALDNLEIESDVKVLTTPTTPAVSSCSETSLKRIKCDQCARRCLNREDMEYHQLLWHSDPLTFSKGMMSKMKKRNTFT